MGKQGERIFGHVQAHGGPRDRKYMIYFSQAEWAEVVAWAERNRNHDQSMANFMVTQIMGLVAAEVPLRHFFEGVVLPLSGEAKELKVTIGSPEASIDFEFDSPEAYDKFIQLPAMKIMPYIENFRKLYGDSVLLSLDTVEAFNEANPSS